jgi:3-oxoadipate enol-lactonase
MPFAQLENTRLHYTTDGERDRPCLVLSNSLGTDLSMWDSQARALADRYFVVRYDTRGHGLSPAGSTPLTLEQLGRDVLGLLDFLGIERAHFCGISMGGLTGQWLGVAAPQRIGKLVLANTAACIGSAQGWIDRARMVRQQGMAPVADGAAGRWFTSGFIARQLGTAGAMVADLGAQDAQGYAACCEALAHADLKSVVGTIPNETLVIAGRHDPVTTVADADWLAHQIPNARVVVLEASHLSNVESEHEFTETLAVFLAE